MSKKLWQIIGLEQNNSSIENVSECSTIRISEGQPQYLHDTNQEEIRFFASEPLKNQLFVKSLPVRKQPNKMPEIDVYIESCESQNQEEELQGQSPKFCKRENLNEEIKCKVKDLSLAVTILRQKWQMWKTDSEYSFISFRNQLSRSLQQLQKYTVESQVLSSKCCKCDSNKRLIESLTKQWLEMERHLKAKTLQNESLYQQFKCSKEDPLREVQFGLLEERGEIIRRIRWELDTAMEQNDYLRGCIKSLQEERSIIENNYKKSLIQLNNQMEQISQFSDQKHQKLLEDKMMLQYQLKELNKKYESLLYQSQIVTQSKETKFQPSSINPVIKDFPHISANSYLKNIDNDNYRDFHYSHHYRGVNTQAYNETSLQSAQCDDHKAWQNFSVHFFKTLRQNGERSLNVSNSKKMGKKNDEIANRGSSLRKALDGLAEIKREVRRQIKRSEQSCK